MQNYIAILFVVYTQILDRIYEYTYIFGNSDGYYAANYDRISQLTKIETIKCCVTQICLNL